MIIRIVGTAFHAQDMIYGAERTLADSIRLSYENFEPALIAVLNCSAPAIMGDDIEGVILSRKKEIPAEILSLSTGGYEGPAWIGYEETLTELTRFMVERDKEANSVNIIGFKQDEIRAYSNLLEIERMLNRQGITVNSVLTNSRFEVMKNAKCKSQSTIDGDNVSFKVKRALLNFILHSKEMALHDAVKFKKQKESFTHGIVYFMYN